MKKKFTAVVLLVLALVMLLPAIPAAAAEPYQSYTYSIDGYALYSPDAYSPVMTIDSNYMGLSTPFDEPTDIFADKDGNIYLADSKNSRIIVLDRYFKVRFTLKEFDNEFGATYSLSGPRGVFVTDEYIYVADTGNSRIVVFYREDCIVDGEEHKAGEFFKVIPAPESKLFGNSASYKPVALAVDQYGRIFVVSSTTYQGVIVMTDEGEFTGFIGAQKVNYSLIDIIWRRFMSEEQLKNSVTYVSTEFNNITVDAEGFIYVTTDAIDSEKQIESIKSKSSDYSPVKKLNSAGSEIMKRNGFFDPGGEVDINQSFDAKGQTGPSKIRDVAVGPQETWSIIDASRNKVFTYDQNGNLLFAFGDTGEMLGQMKGVCGITYQGDNMVLLDNITDTITVYRRTNYGNLLISALKAENDRKYSEAVEAWQDVLMYNNNFDTAYIGVGKSLHRNGDYEEAMEYFKAAYDGTNYSNSYREVRKAWISGKTWFIPNLLVIVAVVVLAVLGLLKAMKYAGKLNAAVAVKQNRTKTTYWEELVYCVHVSMHPFDGFWDLKHEKRGSLRASLTFIGLTVLAFFYQSVGTGFIMNTKGEYSTIITQIISVAVPILLWIIANWCLTTLFDGEGSFRDITIAVGYAIAPLPIFLVVSTLFSNIVVMEEAMIVSLLTTLGFVWCALLLFFGLMVTHDYSMGKNLIIVICTILGMAIIIFMALLFSGLIGKMVSFVSSIITEIAYRF